MAVEIGIFKEPNVRGAIVGATSLDDQDHQDENQLVFITYEVFRKLLCRFKTAEFSSPIIVDDELFTAEAASLLATSTINGVNHIYAFRK